MQDAIRRLSEPVRWGSFASRNRIVMAPMQTVLANPDDTVSDRQVAYYSTRARGGVGIMVAEATVVCREVRSGLCRLGCYDDRFLPGLARLVESVRAEGARILLQISHSGPKSVVAPGFRSVSISDVVVRDGVVPELLTGEELRQVRRQFAAAARRVQQAGFDGVEIHAAHMYLLSASLSPFTNTRTDEYGGNTANRTRLTREVLEEVRSAVGGQFPVWVRMNGCEGMQGGLTPEEAQEVAVRLEEAGASAIDVSAFVVPLSPSQATPAGPPFSTTPNRSMPPGSFLEYAATIKRGVGVPVIAAGKLDDPSLAAAALAQGKCDLVALGRQLLCDPYWPKKVEQGRLEEIVPCDYCMSCHGAVVRGKEVRCAQNLNLLGEPSYPRLQRSGS